MEAEELHDVRYYSLPAHSTVLVDQVAHQNYEAESIFLLDKLCVIVADVTGNFFEGGHVTINADGSHSFEPGASRAQVPRFLAGADEWTAARDTCEEAAKGL